MNMKSFDVGKMGSYILNMQKRDIFLMVIRLGDQGGILSLDMLLAQ